METRTTDYGFFKIARTSPVASDVDCEQSLSVSQNQLRKHNNRVAKQSLVDSLAALPHGFRVSSTDSEEQKVTARSLVAIKPI